MQSLGAIHAKNQPSVANDAPQISFNAAPQGADTLLNKAIRAIAGNPINPASRSELEDLSKAKLNPLRVAIAKEVYGLAHNQSNIANYVSKASNAIYIAGMLLGKPMENIVAIARKSEFGLSTLRRLSTGAALNSPMKMLASFLGISNIFTKNENVGELLYLQNASQVACGDASESVLSAAKRADAKNEAQLLSNGAYKDLLAEPKFFFSKISSSLKELIKNPLLIKDPKWRENSSLESFTNFLLAFLVKHGLKSNNLGLARFARTGLTLHTDKNKARDEFYALRQHSATAFALEAAADAANGSLFNGKSIRMSSLVATLGQVGRYMGAIYHNPEFKNLSTHNLLTQPGKFFSESIKSILKYANPLTQQSQSTSDSKFEEILRLNPKAPEAAPSIDHARKLAEAVGNIAKTNKPETLSSETKAKKADSRTRDYEHAYDDYYSSTVRTESSKAGAEVPRNNSSSSEAQGLHTENIDLDDLNLRDDNRSHVENITLDDLSFVDDGIEARHTGTSH